MVSFITQQQIKTSRECNRLAERDEFFSKPKLKKKKGGLDERLKKKKGGLDERLKKKKGGLDERLKKKLKI